MDKWVKALHSESEGSQLKPRLPVTLGSNKYQTMIEMELVTLPLYSGPKLALDQVIPWWSGLPGGLAVGGNLVFCFIIVVIFIWLGRAYRLVGQGGGGILKLSNGGQATKGWDHFYLGSWPLKTPCKDFNLAIVGGLGWMKWLKNGAGKCLYFMQLLLHCILCGENFIG